MMKCDPVSGACLLPDSPAATPALPAPSVQDVAVCYVGDPMCSWCWGISPAVRQVAEFCDAEGITFALTMGGLRVGGGDPWNGQFKSFLRREWQHIGEVTGQPFGFGLLEAGHFDYDTEPACRAVVAARMLAAQRGLPAAIELVFFATVQQHFYMQGQDPKRVDFYRPVCMQVGLSFEEFRALFDSAAARDAVQTEFARCREWGVRSFPTILLRQGRRVTPLAVGFVTAQVVLQRLREALAAA